MALGYALWAPLVMAGLLVLGPAAGALLWGMGAALGFPVALSAGADNPAGAADRVGVITSIGYCGFVGGPPVIGFVAGRTTLVHALLVVAVLMAGSVTLAGAARSDLPVSRRPPPAAPAVASVEEGDNPC